MEPAIFRHQEQASRHGLASLYAGKLGTGPLSEVARAALDALAISAPVAADADHGRAIVAILPKTQAATIVTRAVENHRRVAPLGLE